jgi:S-adenosylmethionine:tRNA ribosyltransferase-isomerase
MSVSNYNFNLPDDLIARFPLKNRRDSRLMVLDCYEKKIIDSEFKSLCRFTAPNDLLVFNDTKVINARIFGNKPTGGKVEILIERVIDKWNADVLIKANKSLSVGAKILFESDQYAIILSKSEEIFRIKFSIPVEKQIEKSGQIPIPPYFNRPSNDSDIDRYQTIYAKNSGAVAAPTAGLHFDEDMIHQSLSSNVSHAFITLHIGVGTFLPLKNENIDENKLHSEYIEVNRNASDSIAKAKKNNGRVIAIGTTSTRALESASKDNVVLPYQGETSIFIKPGYKFRVVDALLTNFHLPMSSLLMLVSAMAGKKFIMKAYNHAIKNKYRFYSYGDAMLILPKGFK